MRFSVFDDPPGVWMAGRIRAIYPVEVPCNEGKEILKEVPDLRDPRHLLRNHLDCARHVSIPLKPRRRRELSAPQTECMSALRVQAHFHGNPTLFVSEELKTMMNFYAARAVYVRRWMEK
jgi:hypothetical protein